VLKAENLASFMCRLCSNYRSPNFLESQGHVQACNGRDSFVIDVIIVVTTLTLSAYKKTEKSLKVPTVFGDDDVLFTDECRITEGADLISKMACFNTCGRNSI
jgi:hypothetical protein